MAATNGDGQNLLAFLHTASARQRQASRLQHARPLGVGLLPIVRALPASGENVPYFCYTPHEHSVLGYDAFPTSVRSLGW